MKKVYVKRNMVMYSQWEDLSPWMVSQCEEVHPTSAPAAQGLLLVRSVGQARHLLKQVFGSV